MEYEDPYIKHRIARKAKLNEAAERLGIPKFSITDSYIAKRQEVIKEVHNYFWKLEKLELTSNRIKITTNDQSGYPFVALYMEINTGHSEEYIMEMFLNAVKLLKVSK